MFQSGNSSQDVSGVIHAPNLEYLMQFSKSPKGSFPVSMGRVGMCVSGLSARNDTTFFY